MRPEDWQWFAVVRKSRERRCQRNRQQGSLSEETGRHFKYLDFILRSREVTDESLTEQ